MEGSRDRQRYHDGGTRVASASREPIAIVGVGCRLPGNACDARSFWHNLYLGLDAVTEIPADRWDINRFYHPERSRRGKIYTRYGAFVCGADLFDAGFFGISAREAERMDPQQRLLLEVAWEAVEDAQQVFDRRVRNHVGVFIGISNVDYGKIQTAQGEVDAIDMHSGTGTAFSIAANRISHALNLGGPSLAVDTACSSSLVAVHLACESLRAGECEAALVGGVNLILSPEPYVGFSRLGMLSADGRCKAFDASADGFGRGEGAGVVVLRPLTHATRDGDRIYAVILGSGVNQDGRTPGITAPNGHAQESLIRQVHSQTGIGPAEVVFFEAHGTGTALGDPVEANAVGAALCEGRKADRPLYIGSVKTNIGHLESASGIAGLIKAALTVRHRIIPPNLHFCRPNPEISFNQLHLKVPCQPIPVPPDRPMVVSVNSFGFGGTNAHVLLGPPPEPEHPVRGEREGRTASLLCVSAASAASLARLASRYVEFVRGQAWSNCPLLDICRSAATRRIHHPHRLAVWAESKQQLQELLEAHANKESVAGLATGKAAELSDRRTAFVFCGQGPQWWAMGRELLDTEPIFRATIEECDRKMREYAPWSLLAELTRSEEDSRLVNTSIAQPVLFALQLALAELWKSWGIVPHAVVGHSSGEVAAACVGGTLSFADALRVIVHRGRCMDFVGTAAGKMLAVGLGESQLQPYLARHRGQVVVAAFNSPDMLTVSGDAEAVDAVEQTLIADGVFCRPLRVPYAFHSNHMEVAKEELLASLAEIRPTPSSLPVYSTAAGRRAAEGDFDAQYWWLNVRQPVQFSNAMELLIRDGYRVFVEIGPHPVLASSIAGCLGVAGGSGSVLPSLRRNEPERKTLSLSLGRLYTLGWDVNWSGFFRDSGPRVSLPPYPWDRERYWFQTDTSRQMLTAVGEHRLLGRRVSFPTPAWEQALNEVTVPFLADHRIQGQIVFPATGYLEMAAAVAAEYSDERSPVIENVEFHRAVFLGGDRDLTFCTTHDPTSLALRIFSRAGTDESWQFSAAGVILSNEPAAPESVSLDAVRAACTTEMSREECYRSLRRHGLEYGPTFQGIERLFCGDGQALARIAVPEQLGGVTGDYRAHPAVLDACLQTIFGAGFAEGERSYLPVSIERVQLSSALPQRLWCHAYDVGLDGEELVASLRVLDDEGRIIAEIRRVRCRAVAERDLRNHVTVDDMLFESRWVPAPLPGRTPRRPPVHSVPPLNEIADSVRDAWESLPFEADVPELDPLCAGYVVNAFLDLGWTGAVGDTFAAETLRQNLGVTESHGALFKRLLKMLSEDGIIRLAASGEWQVPEDVRRRDVDAVWRRLIADRPETVAKLRLLDRCGSRLAEALTGKVDPLELIFPNGDMSTAEQLYQDSPGMRESNFLVQELVYRTMEKMPPRRRVRLLEIGAGTGGTTAYVLPTLAEREAEYVYTDISRYFFQQAEQKFRDFSFVRYETLNIEVDPMEQGFEPRSVDIILAPLVLHATTSLRQTLKNVLRLLARGGIVVVTEILSPMRWTDLIFGLLEGWWRFRDTDLRPDHASLSLAKWRSLLNEMGFDEVCDFARNVSHQEAQEGAVIVARGPRHDDRPVAELRREPTPGANGCWLVFSDRSGSADALAERLRGSGERCVRVLAGDAFAKSDDEQFVIRPGSPEDVRRLFDAITAGPSIPLRGLVHLRSLDLPTPDSPHLGSADAAALPVYLEIIETMREASRLPETPRIWLVTRGAQSVTGANEQTAPLQAGLWGLGRTIVREHPEYGCTLIDLDPAADQPPVECLLAEFRSQDDEDEVAYRDGERFVHRLLPASVRHAWTAESEECGTAFRLEAARPGELAHVRTCADSRVEPTDDEVEVEVHAAGVNFSDVMKVLGIYPGLAPRDVSLGIECAGIVRRRGRRVKSVKLGDRVMAVCPGGFRSHTVVPASALIPIPEEMSFTSAATMPVAFFTAHHALVDKAQLRPGERLLIHSAAGGVGLAAVQVAQHIGAEIYATAGTEEKRDFLRRLGIRHVMNSRSLRFALEIRESTGGEGVDVVLNSLAGEAISKGLSILRPYGRFLELGKRDIYANRSLGLAPFRNNLSMFSIDLDLAMRRRPELIGNLKEAVAERISSGDYTPLPHRLVPVARAGTALQALAKGSHIGKLVLTLRDHRLSPVVSPSPPISFDPAATYLVTGGFGGFGLLLAQWLVDCGARRLVLMGRRGAVNEESQGAVAAMRAQGASVIEMRGDVADERALCQVLEIAHTKEAPLRGVFHAAMVLDDVPLRQMDEGSLRDVYRPKVTGAIHLHRKTATMGLRHFVLFSSFSTIVGMGGQGNYAAANAVLDALAHYRRSQGRPGLSINWGGLGGVGTVAKLPEIAERFRRYGMESVSPQQALDALGRCLFAESTNLSVCNMDWAAFGVRLREPRLPPRFTRLCTANPDATGGETPARQDLRACLSAARSEDRYDLLLTALALQVAQLLGQPREKLDLDRSLADLGLDSLMAVELRNWVESTLGVRLTTVEFMGSPNLPRLAQRILASLAPAEPGLSVTPHAREAASAEAREREPLVVMLHSGGAGMPLACVHPAGGGVGIYRALADELRPPRPVYGIEARSSHEVVEAATLAAMATRYAEVVHREHPDGPHCLIGWSAAGIIALKVAEILENAGHVVGFVGMIDSRRDSLALREGFVRNAAAAIRELTGHVGPTPEMDPQTVREGLELYESLQSFSGAERADRLLNWFIDQGGIPPTVPSEIIRERFLLLDRHTQLVGAAEIAQIQAPVFLWVAKEQLAASGSPCDEWAGVTRSRLHHKSLDGNHFSLLRPPQVQILAACVAEAFNAAGLP